MIRRSQGSNSYVALFNKPHLSVSRVNMLWNRASLTSGGFTFPKEIDPSIQSLYKSRKSSRGSTFDDSSESTESSYMSGQLGEWGVSGIPNRNLCGHRDPDVQMLTANRNTVAECDYLKHLGRHPETRQFILLKLSLRGKCLKDLCAALGTHRFLQCVDLSHNELVDVSALQQLPHLMNLDLSYNRITDTLAFTAPWYLTHADLSHNCVKAIFDLSEFWSLVYLDLSYNEIHSISGLCELRFLRYLNLSHNKIQRIENLNHLDILELDLSYNRISCFEYGDNNGLHTLQSLRLIDLEGNNLRSLQLLSGLKKVLSLLVGYNLIEHVVELTHLRGLDLVFEVEFTGNPICKHSSYRDIVLDTLKSLETLDREKVDPMEKIRAQQRFNPSPLIQATRMYQQLVDIERLQGNDIPLGPDVRPCDECPIPLITLVGPPASGIGSLCFRMAQELPDLIHWAPLYTTRRRAVNYSSYINDVCLELGGSGYIYITREEFTCMLMKGQFVAVDEDLGESYGICCGDFGIAARDLKLIIIPSSLRMALVLRLKGLCPFIIRTMPSSITLHKTMIADKYGDRFEYQDLKSINVVQPILTNLVNKCVEYSGYRPPKHRYDKHVIIHSPPSHEHLLESKDISLRSINSSIVSSSMESNNSISNPRVSFKRTRADEENTVEEQRNRPSCVYGSVSTNWGAKLEGGQSYGEIPNLSVLSQVTFAEDANKADRCESYNNDPALLPQRKSIDDSPDDDYKSYALKEILKEREIYEINDDTVNFYHAVIDTDDIDEAVQTLIPIVRNVYATGSKHEHKKRACKKVHKLYASSDVGFDLEPRPSKINTNNLRNTLSCSHALEECFCKGNRSQ